MLKLNMNPSDNSYNNCAYLTLASTSTDFINIVALTENLRMDLLFLFVQLFDITMHLLVSDGCNESFSLEGVVLSTHYR